MSEETDLTDAEKLAAAEAAMLAAAEAAKAARLPSAMAALDLLQSEAASDFLAAVRAAVEVSVDDMPRMPGQSSGPEGTKQSLQRIITSIDLGLGSIQSRIAALQPTIPSAPAPEEPSEPA